MSTPSTVVFNETYYLQRNPDVANAVWSGVFASARDHWEQFGKNEGRDSTPFFDWEVYRDNNPDLAEAGLTTKLQLTQHFITYGYNENRLFVSEKIFDAAYYAKQNPDLEQAGITSAPSLQQHFLTLGMHEGREFHPDFNGTAYIESNADLNALMNAGGNIGGYSKDEINTAGIYHYLNWGINEGRSVPPAPEPPAPPPPVVDEGPTLYFSISLSSNVVSFQTNVSGDITMAKSDNDAVFSKPGGYQQTQTDFFTAETNFTLSDGQVLATTADVITGLVPTSTGSGRIKVTGADGIQLITGTQGNDELAGGAGEDRLTGGAGDDVLTGGADADTFNVAFGGEGLDRITDFANSDDIIDFTGTSDVVLSASGNEGVFLSVAASPDATTITLSAGFNALTGITSATLASDDIATALTNNTNGSFLVANGDVLYIAVNATDIDSGTDGNQPGAVIARIAAEDEGGFTVNGDEITPIIILAGVDASDLRATNFTDFTDLIT